MFSDLFDIQDIVFANKEFLWLLLIIPLLAVYYYFKKDKYKATLNYSSFYLIQNIPPSFKLQSKFFPYLLRLLTIFLLIIALARPQSISGGKDVQTEGIDIMISLDVSLSMLAKDFKPNRLEVAKEVIQEFVDNRPNDRIGMVIFGGEAFTQCPLTTDHKILKTLIQKVKAGSLGQGTAIGLGLANAIARLKDVDSKSKIIILVSDGVNNSGEIDPITAGELAKTYNIKVYTIGIGSRGKALQPVAMYPNGELQYDYADVEIDEALMKKISEETNGKYYRATDNKSLKAIYDEIDKLEKNIILEKNYTNRKDLYLPFAFLALILLLLEFTLQKTYYKTIT
ncbi:MAG TPA: VWA domain-containing protein [Bacteroidia bacterium]|jgi:Ca-activated chloride channel family protein|nr:VWA domain-containing protein [Bacteroidia bacterium]